VEHKTDMESVGIPWRYDLSAFQLVDFAPSYEQNS